MLSKVLASQSESSYVLLRFVSGALFAFHGVQKVFGVFGGDPPPLFSQMGVGGVIELVAGALIAVGLFTRPAAFLASGTMAVAYFQFHWGFTFDETFFPAVNKGELAVIYCFVFLYIACKGAGRASLDR